MKNMMKLCSTWKKLREVAAASSSTGRRIMMGRCYDIKSNRKWSWKKKVFQELAIRASRENVPSLSYFLVSTRIEFIFDDGNVFPLPPVEVASVSHFAFQPENSRRENNRKKRQQEEKKKMKTEKILVEIRGRWNKSILDCNPSRISSSSVCGSERKRKEIEPCSSQICDVDNMCTNHQRNDNERQQQQWGSSKRQQAQTTKIDSRQVYFDNTNIFFTLSVLLQILPHAPFDINTHRLQYNRISVSVFCVYLSSQVFIFRLPRFTHRANYIMLLLSIERLCCCEFSRLLFCFSHNKCCHFLVCSSYSQFRAELRCYCSVIWSELSLFFFGMGANRLQTIWEILSIKSGEE